MSSRPSFLVQVKVFFYKCKYKFKSTIASAIRMYPTLARALNIPSFRISNVKSFINKNSSRKVSEAGCLYQCLHTPMTIKPIKPKSPTNNRIPVFQEELRPKKHYNYWDLKSGFDARNGFYHKEKEIFEETFLLKLSNARILGPSGAVITSNGGLLDESLWTWDNWITNDRSLTSVRLPLPQKETGVYYSVVSNYAEGYPHWLMEVLPRLQGLEMLQSQSREKPIIIFNRKLNNWQNETIRLLGFDNYPSISLEDKYIEVETLYLPGYVGIPGTPHPLGCKWVRDKILANIKPEPHSKRIYITRKLAVKRKVVNEEEVMGVLKKFDFIEVAAEKLSFVEQVQLFGGAESVVATHGAGLGNLMFVPENCKVLEILDREYVNDHYYNLSSVLGLDYYYQLCTSVNADLGKKANPGWDHVKVDLDKLEQSLMAMFPDTGS